jgi:hypothetical protein
MFWIKHRAEILHKQNIVNVIEDIFESKWPNHKRKYISSKVIKTIPIQPIPLEEYEHTKQHFDSSGLQSDDRFYSSTIMLSRRNEKICQQTRKIALKGYNTEPIMITKPR